MGSETSLTDDPIADSAGEHKLRGTALNGSERKYAADHSEYERERNPDTELRVDGETGTLFSDESTSKRTSIRRPALMVGQGEYSELPQSLLDPSARGEKW
jgi:hypothetical protein